jgi:DNA-binding transcriptional LysR family regulator
MAGDPGRIDLDGLQVFDAIMRERNVTRAADRLALTQPAVSHALARLRLVFKDPLFLRAPGGVKPTRRAEQLWVEVQEALDTLRKAVQPDRFDPSSAEFTVSLAVNDMITQELLPGWYRQVHQAAPRMKLSLVMRTFGDTETRLAQGTLDFGLGLFYSLPPALRRCEIWTDHYVCLFRRGHPIARRSWSLEAFQAAEHVAVSPDGDLFTYADAALRYAGVERQVVLLVSHFSSVPRLLQATDLVALMPSFYAAAVAQAHGLEVRDPPFAMQPFKYELVWHERAERSQALGWFRERLVGALAAAQPPPPGKKRRRAHP